MHLTPLALTALTVNPNNDRHGELQDEASAIEWLLSRREQHMKNLAADIVAQGKLYDAPLVAEEGGRYIVYDGNRRVTCLKLLAEPSLAPTQQLREYFHAQRTRWSGEFPTMLDCQIERDREVIDEILFRRHTGSQSGVGQSHWDDTAKHNFISRTGRRNGRNVAEGIEKKLLAVGYSDTEGAIPRSNLNRLLSSEEFRNLVGISLSDGQLYFTADPEKTLLALHRIAEDLMAKRLVLGDLWNNDGKRSYLSELKGEGILPSQTDELRVPVAFEKVSPPKRRSPHVRNVPCNTRRATLIQTDVDFSITWASEMIRLKNIWSELQQLPLDRYPNSVAVTFRVLLELTVDYYLSVHRGVGANEGDPLSKKTARTATHLAERGIISDKYNRELQKFAFDESLISTSTMHRYVHSQTFDASPRHLTAIWDTLSEFLVRCLNEGASRQRAA